MRIHQLVVGMLFTSVLFGQVCNATQSQFNNEKAITFQADSGDSTDAFEGFIMVPENRNNPDSRQIRVNYVRFPATGETSGSPTVYLAGGPGGSGIATAKWRRYPLFMAMREFGDVIALDQRGTGQSEKTEECVSEEQIKLTERVTDDVIGKRYRLAAQHCLNFWQQQGIDVYGYTTVQNALDIDDLRKHLQAKKVNLWGISYGSHLALAAIKLFPEQIDRVILASAEGLDQTVKLPAYSDDYFARIQKVLDKQALGKKITDLPVLMQRVHQTLERNPLTLAVKQRDGSTAEMLFQRHHMQMLASMAIADPGRYLAMLLHIYLGLDNGNNEYLLHALQMGMFNQESISFKLMPLAMDVASGISDKRLKKVQQQVEKGLLGSYLNFPMPMLNNLDTKLDLGDSFRMAPVSQVSTLLFTGTLDGRTYPAEQSEAVRGLENLIQIEVRNAGHNLFTSSPEVLQRMKSFMAGDQVVTAPIELPDPVLTMN